jgi:membrane protein YdbS with pleckstrin-like domain
VLALSATGGALLGTLYGRLAHARLRVSAHRGFFVVHRGVLWIEEVTVPAARIEAAILSRTPLDRFHGVATVTVVVGGGDRFSVANVSLPHAAELIGDLQAAESGEASGSLWGAS